MSGRSVLVGVGSHLRGEGGIGPAVVEEIRGLGPHDACGQRRRSAGLGGGKRIRMPD